MRNLQTALFGALILVSASSLPAQSVTNGPTQAPPAFDAELRAKTAGRLEAVAAKVDGILSYAIVDLTTGERFSHGERRVAPTASVIKIAILYELFRQADEGRVRLDETRPLDRAHAVPGGVLYDTGTPALSLRDHAVLMIVLSDNTATNVLIDRLGMPVIGARLSSLGLADTRLRRRMIDAAAARRGDENVSSAADLVRLMQVIHDGQGLRPESHRDMLALLQKEKVPGAPMTDALPVGVVAASKPGDLEGVRAAAGIVYAENRPYAFVALANWLADEHAGERAIGELSRIAYDYFSRLGKGTAYGRLMGR